VCVGSAHTMLIILNARNVLSIAMLINPLAAVKHAVDAQINVLKDTCHSQVQRNARYV
jgi:hypothetical protein